MPARIVGDIITNERLLRQSIITLKKLNAIPEKKQKTSYAFRWEITIVKDLSLNMRALSSPKCQIFIARRRSCSFISKNGMFKKTTGLWFKKSNDQLHWNCTFSFTSQTHMESTIKWKIKNMEPAGIDPAASCMLSRRSTIWATAPLKLKKPKWLTWHMSIENLMITYLMWKSLLLPKTQLIFQYTWSRPNLRWNG